MVDLTDIYLNEKINWARRAFDCRSGKSRNRTNTEGLKITKELSQTPLLQTLRGA